MKNVNKLPKTIWTNNKSVVNVPSYNGPNQQSKVLMIVKFELMIIVSLSLFVVSRYLMNFVNEKKKSLFWPMKRKIFVSINEKEWWQNVFKNDLFFFVFSLSSLFDRRRLHWRCIFVLYFDCHLSFFRVTV